MDKATAAELEKTLSAVAAHQAELFEIAANMIEGMHRLEPTLTPTEIVSRLRDIASRMKSIADEAC